MKHWPSYLFRERRTATDYLCEFDHDDIDRARESILWHGSWDEQTAQLMDVMSRLNVLHRGAAVLDYGCGIGRVAKAVRLACDDAVIFAADRSAKMLAHAAMYLAGHNVSLCTDQEALAASETFDVVLAIEVLQHIPQVLLGGVLHALLGRLRPDGRLFVYGNEHLDIGFRGLPGTTTLRSELDRVCSIAHFEVVPRTAGADPDRHVFLCVRAT